MKLTQAAFKRLKKAKQEGRLVIIRHPADRYPCDHCGKKNAGWAIAICTTKEETEEDFEQVGPNYLNGECYLVGSVCLKAIKEKL